MGRRALASPILGETPVLTRDEASMLSRTIYFTGTLCGNGHLDWRYVSNGACRSCMKPPKPLVPYMGSAGYKAFITLRIKILAIPQDEAQRKSLVLKCERVAQDWAYEWGLAKKPVDDD